MAFGAAGRGEGGGRAGTVLFSEACLFWGKGGGVEMIDYFSVLFLGTGGNWGEGTLVSLVDELLRALCGMRGRVGGNGTKPTRSREDHSRFRSQCRCRMLVDLREGTKRTVCPLSHFHLLPISFSISKPGGRAKI